MGKVRNKFEQIPALNLIARNFGKKEGVYSENLSFFLGARYIGALDTCRHVSKVHILYKY